MVKTMLFCEISSEIKIRDFLGRLQNCAAKLPPFCKVVFLTSSAIAGDVFQKNFNGCVRDLIPLQELLSSQSYEMELRSS